MKIMEGAGELILQKEMSVLSCGARLVPMVICAPVQWYPLLRDLCNTGPRAIRRTLLLVDAEIPRFSARDEK
jgi:hypothetical protein